MRRTFIGIPGMRIAWVYPSNQNLLILLGRRQDTFPYWTVGARSITTHYGVNRTAKQLLRLLLIHSVGEEKKTLMRIRSQSSVPRHTFAPLLLASPPDEHAQYQLQYPNSNSKKNSPRKLRQKFRREPGGSDDGNAEKVKCYSPAASLYTFPVGYVEVFLLCASIVTSVHLDERKKKFRFARNLYRDGHGMCVCCVSNGNVARCGRMVNENAGGASIWLTRRCQRFWLP